MRIYIEPHDLWVGVYVGPDAVYVCPLPTLVIKFNRRMKRVGLGISCLRCGAPVVYDFYCEEHLPPVIRDIRDGTYEAVMSGKSVPRHERWMDYARCPDCGRSLAYDLTGIMVKCLDCGYQTSVAELRKLYDADSHQFGLARPSQRTPAEDAAIHREVKD